MERFGMSITSGDVVGLVRISPARFKQQVALERYGFELGMPGLPKPISIFQALLP